MVIGAGSEVGVDSGPATEGPCVLGDRWILSKAARAWAGTAELAACKIWGREESPRTAVASLRRRLAWSLSRSPRDTQWGGEI